MLLRAANSPTFVRHVCDGRGLGQLARAVQTRSQTVLRVSAGTLDGARLEHRRAQSQYLDRQRTRYEHSVDTRVLRHDTDNRQRRQKHEPDRDGGNQGFWTQHADDEEIGAQCNVSGIRTRGELRRTGLARK